MPMLCPSVPTDKNKQGGRNYDASKSTDFKKIGTISKTDTSKVPGVNNNRNPQTDTDEQRRASVLIAGLRSIPRAYCPVCPNASTGNIFNTKCTTGIIGSGYTTFWIMYGNGSGGNVYTYGTNTITPNPANDTFTANGGYAKVLCNIATALIGASTRTDILNAINSVLTANTGAGKTITLPLTASFTPDGKLIFSTPSNIDAGFLFGLYFGTADNGSTALGVTSSPENGVDYAAILITGGTNSVTAPLQIAC
jgi:hypothetical protein